MLHGILKKVESDSKISKKVHFEDLENNNSNNNKINKKNKKNNNNLFISRCILFGIGIISIILIIK
jgi:hypothetical protein